MVLLAGQKVRTQQRKRGYEKRYGIDVIIPKSWLVDLIDPIFEQKTGLKSVLMLIQDPKQGFSRLSRQLAGILYKKFGRQNWGLPDEEDDETLLAPGEAAGSRTHRRGGETLEAARGLRSRKRHGWNLASQKHQHISQHCHFTPES
jgi:hypothetical protein